MDALPDQRTDADQRTGADQRTDAELLAAHVAGDPRAFSALYARHRPRLNRLATAHTRSREDAAEVLQEAMLAAHRGAPRFRQQAAVGSWLYRIVLNACRDRLRQRRHQPAAPLDETLLAVPDRSAEITTALTVRRALMQLPVEQRAAVLAVDMHGLSVARTARLLGVAEGTVKSRCARGRRRLAVVLGPGRAELG